MSRKPSRTRQPENGRSAIYANASICHASRGGNQHTAHLAAVLVPMLDTGAVLCTDGPAALAAVARHIGVEHHAINASKGKHAHGPWHINNVNGHHSRLKNWLRRFNGVAPSYLPHDPGWFRILQPFRPATLSPPALLALAIGICSHPHSTRIARKDVAMVQADGGESGHWMRSRSKQSGTTISTRMTSP